MDLPQTLGRLLEQNLNEGQTLVTSRTAPFRPGDGGRVGEATGHDSSDSEQKPYYPANPLLASRTSKPCAHRTGPALRCGHTVHTRGSAPAPARM